MESIGADLEVMKRRPLADSHVAAIREIADEVAYSQGEMVAQIGDPMDRFVYVLEGEIEVVNPYTGERWIESSLGPTQFMGEIAFLNAGTFTIPMRAAKPTKTLEAPREKMLQLMSDIPELSDHIITVFSARRRRQFEDNRSSIKLIGADRDAKVQAVASFLSRNRIPFQSFDMDGGDDETQQLCDLTDHQPSVIYAKDHVVEDPTPRKIAQLLGLDLNVEKGLDVDVLIVGGGPAGVAAAVYAGAEGLCALVVEDDEGVRSLFTRSLEGDGWSVDEAENGAIALERVAAHRPDLVLLDVLLPKVRGPELAEKLLKKLPKTRILVVSARQEPAMLRGILKKGIHG